MGQSYILEMNIFAIDIKINNRLFYLLDDHLKDKHFFLYNNEKKCYLSI